MAHRSEVSLLCVDSVFYLDSYGYNLSISSDGNVYTFGSSIFKLNNKRDIKIHPEIIYSSKNIRSISCSTKHVVFLDDKGSVFGLGQNTFGQLGIAKPEIITNLRKISLPPIKQVACGSDFTICVSELGEVYSFGENGNQGQLGLGDKEDYAIPQRIELLKDVDFVECGFKFTFCKDKNNNVYCWGNNYYGQLGNGSKSAQTYPILCEDIPDNIVDIRCGQFHTLILTYNQEVFSTGHNYHGELGRKTDDSYDTSFKKIEDLSDIIRIQCGNDHSMCIDINNDLYVFGSNRYGELGLGDINDRRSPVRNEFISDIVDISSGGYHTFVKTSSNEIYAFGINRFSQIGIKTEKESQNEPIQVFQNNGDLWDSFIKQTRAKSARSVI